MQSPKAPTLREQAERRANGSHSPMMNCSNDESNAVATPTAPPRQSSQETPSPQPQQLQQLQQFSHPLDSASRGKATPESLAQSARKEWKRHGSGLTQSLEEKRLALDRMPGTWTVRVLSAETRRDASGAKFTAYILKVQIANGEHLEIEHRYSEFAKLHDLFKNHNITLNCAFPEKHWAGRLGQWTPSLKWAPVQHQDLIEYRKIQLDVWLVHVVEQYNLGALPTHIHQAVYTFLTHSDRPPCEQDNIIWGDPTSTAESWTRWNNPLSFTLGSNIRQATSTVEHMFKLGNGKGGNLLNESDQSIPLDLLHCARGLCFMTVIKAGLVVSGRLGTGLLIARIDKDMWSAPCALGTVGMGWGMLAGGDITHYLVVLTTTDAVDALLGGTVQLGAELGVAVGPIGRGMTSQVATGGDWTVHPAYSYAHSQGLFMGMSLEGSVLSSRPDVNAKFYGTHFPASQILDLPPPKAAQPLYQALNKAMALEIPEDAFRPSQMFQDKYAQHPPRRKVPTSPVQPDVDQAGRVSVPDLESSSNVATPNPKEVQNRKLF